MRFILIICAVGLLSFSQITEWEEFRSNKGKFKILTEGKLKEQVNYRETDLGLIIIHSFVHSAENKKEADNFMYSVTYYDFPKGSLHSDSTELVQDFFDMTIEGSHKNIGGKLMYSDKIMLDEYEGRNWRVDYGNGFGSLRTHAYIVGNRFYSIQTYTVKEKGLNGSIERFMGSFKLLR